MSFAADISLVAVWVTPALTLDVIAWSLQGNPDQPRSDQSTRELRSWSYNNQQRQHKDKYGLFKLPAILQSY